MDCWHGRSVLASFKGRLCAFGFHPKAVIFQPGMREVCPVPGCRSHHVKVKSAVTGNYPLGSGHREEFHTPTAHYTQREHPSTLDQTAMCIHVYTLHAACSHRQFQNTFACESARGGGSTYDNLHLARTVHLPAREEMGTPVCEDPRQRRATRPVGGWCSACIAQQRREERERKREAEMTDESESGSAGSSQK
ncbi:hypothetical protein B0T11DRAFT_48688 [Plectosphaerella cucumerina]|jgi:hypothetical protein|uniref:Uncharacterized protein n=1 Tax=Plectosphaerella cucumerina TaxID=40658 RepID=A0A8K0TLT9_9PEZI|nr:hypothetical protein B0T11DRAFT_48688 [Plectosphaerella cucumerina]